MFGTAEQVTGSRAAGMEDGRLNQYAVEAIYRFLDDDVYVGGRYNVMNGDLMVGGSWNGDLTVDRWQLGAGWFVTPKVLLKAEYVTQNYDGFPAASVYNGGTFDGFMIEGVIAF